MSNFDQIFQSSLLHTACRIRLLRHTLFVVAFNTKGNALFNLTNILLTIGALALISALATVVRAYRRNRREEVAPFLHYFEPENDRNLFPQSCWSDDEGLYHVQTRVNLLQVHNPSAAEQHSNGTAHRD
jgi:hypothetical protein